MSLPARDQLDTPQQWDPFKGWLQQFWDHAASMPYANKARGAWTAGTAYAAGEYVERSGAIYIAQSGHVSGGSFDADRDAGRWSFLDSALAAAVSINAKVAAVDGQIQQVLAALSEAALITATGQNAAASKASEIAAAAYATTSVNAAANAQATARTAASWANLLTYVGAVQGEGADVLDTDAGTHQQATATGYDGPVVNNAGRYGWSAAWSRWQRLGDTGLAGKISARFETRPATGIPLVGSEYMPGLLSDLTSVKVLAQDIANLASGIPTLRLASSLPATAGFIGRTIEVIGDTEANNGMYRYAGAGPIKIVGIGIAGVLARSTLARAVADTYTELAALRGTHIGRRGFISVSTDTGTHVDPVTTATVANAGHYINREAGWEWVRADDMVNTATKSDVADIAGGWNPRSSVFELSRGEPRYFGDKVTTRMVTLRNPSDSVPYNNVPAAINVGFAQGECPTVPCLVLRNASGVVVPFQWEGALRPFDEASVEFWPDGSVQAGKIWLITTIPAAGSANYTIECHRIAQSTPTTPAVVYTVYSGTTHEFVGGGTRCRFEPGNAFNLRRFQDVANANLDLFNGTNGFYSKLRVSPTDYVSYNLAHVQNVVANRRNSSAFNYGLVFQEWESAWDWAAYPSIRSTMRYRVFADGTCDIRNIVKNSADLASASYRMSAGLIAATTNMTQVYDPSIFAKRCTVSTGTGSDFQVFLVSAFKEHQFMGSTTYPPAETFSRLEEVSTPATFEFGSLGQTVMNAGGSYRNAFVLKRFTPGEADNDWQRQISRIVATASVSKPVTDLADIARIAKSLCAKALPILTVPGLYRWHGVVGLIKLMQSGYSVADEALLNYQQWCAKPTDGTTPVIANPALASGYYDPWAADRLGFEFMGRNTQVLYWLRKAYISRAEPTKVALVESYIHAYADAIVQMEVASGGEGKMNLRGLNPQEDNFNARTSAIVGLATSLSVVANATRQATLDRLVAAYAAGQFRGTGKWSYAAWSSWYNSTTSGYYAYQTFELLLAKKHLPSIALPPNDLLQSVRENIATAGFLEDWWCNYQQSRRGAKSTSMHSAACAYLYPTPDYGLAHEAIRHLENDTVFATPGFDGFVNTVSASDVGFASITNIVMDVRALAEIVLEEGL